MPPLWTHDPQNVTPTRRIILDSLNPDSLIHDSLGDASATQRHRAKAALQTGSSSPLPQRGPLTFETSAMQPYRRFRRSIANPSWCATFSTMSAKPMELLGLNLAIPSAVCPAFAIPAFVSPGLRCKASRRIAPGIRGGAAPNLLGPIP
jgi:hypothetical protein